MTDPNDPYAATAIQPTAPQPTAGGDPYAATAIQSQQGTAAAAPGPTPPQPSGSSISDIVHNYIQYVRSNNPNGVVQGVKDKLLKLGQTAPVGLGRNIDRQVLTLARAARAIDQQTAGVLGIPEGMQQGQQHPLDALIAKGEDYMNKSLPSDPEGREMVNTADDATNLIGYTGLHKLISALPMAQIIEELGPVSKALKNSPNAAKAIIDMIEHGVTGGTQAATQGGGPGEVVKQGLMAAGTAGLFGAPDTYLGARGSLAESVQPTERNLSGGEFTQLANEFRGPEGQQTASEQAQAAASYPRETELQIQRRRAFKDQRTNLAQTGLENALKDANLAVDTPGAATTVPRAAQGWRYIPPEGADQAQAGLKIHRPLTPEETRGAMGMLKDIWLGGEHSPEDEATIQGQYNDMQSQLDRFDQFNTLPQRVQGGAPPAAGAAGAPAFTPGDIQHLVDNTNTYEDAANHLEGIAKQHLGAVPDDVRQQYLGLNAERQQLQTQFDGANGDLAKQNDIMQRMDDLNNRMDEVMQKGATDSPGAMALPKQFTKLAAGFRQLQNVWEKHMTFLDSTANAIDRPNVPENLGSLAKDIEQVRKKYGSVLDPVLGKDGLNHIIELGDLQRIEPGADTKAMPKGFWGNIADVIREQLSGNRGAIGGKLAGAGAVEYLLHKAGTEMAGPAAGVGVLGGFAKFRQLRNRMATDPAYAREMIAAGKLGPSKPDVSIPIPGTSKRPSPMWTLTGQGRPPTPNKRIPGMGLAPVVGSTILNTSDKPDQQPKPTP